MNSKLKTRKIATGKVLFAIMMAICLMVVSVVNTEGSTNRAKTEKVRGKVYEKVEQMPEFPGGQAELINFLMKSVKYPDESLNKGIQGKVLVSFVVGKKGSVLNAKIERGVDPLLDAEALRVVNSMPKWIPGKEKGKDVAVQFIIPISFRFQ